MSGFDSLPVPTAPAMADPAAVQRKLAALKPGKATGVDKAARQFEQMFVSQMLNHMFEGIETDGVFGGGSGEQMFRSMLMDEYGKMIANRGNGIGVATQVKQVLLAQQEVQ